jgi:hypothetical protein
MAGIGVCGRRFGRVLKKAKVRRRRATVGRGWVFHQATGKQPRDEKMPSVNSSRASGGDLANAVEPVVKVGSLLPYALAQLGIGAGPGPALTDTNRIIWEAMRLKDWMNEEHFVEYVWHNDNQTTGALKTAIHRFNSDPESPFKLARENVRIVKLK